MKLQALKGILLVTGFFLLVYVPTFAIVGFIKPGITVAIPLTIVISFVLAIGIIAIRTLHSGSWQEYLEGQLCPLNRGGKEPRCPARYGYRHAFQ